MLGIDLGTAYCAMAGVNKQGEPYVIPMTDGEEILPAVVMVDNDEVVVGKEAKRCALLEPEKVCSRIKRSMGDKVTLLEQNGRKYSPEMLSALIIKKLTNEAAQKLGTPVRDIIITVPAGFSDGARRATADAVELAGNFRLAGMLDEPTASALYYCYKEKRRNGIFLVYDLGGGTFDATLLKVNDGKVTILAKQGVHNAGGVDFDEFILRHVIKTIKEKCGVDLGGPEYEDVRQELLLEAERCKITLSTRMKADMVVRAGNVRERVTISREEFEEMVRLIYLRTESAFYSVLDYMGMSEKDIDRVLLVGGSTQIPYIRNELHKKFGNRVSYELDPNKSVAMGAALYGAYIADKTETAAEKLQDICGYAIGVILCEGNVRKNHVVIPPFEKVPVRAKKRYATKVNNQSKICLEITEAVNKEENPDYVNVICEQEIALPPGVKANTPVDVTIEIDERQMLRVYVNVPEKQVSWECDIKRVSGKSKLQSAGARLIKENNSRKRKISGNIKEYFSDVIGMNEIKERLSGKYAVLCKAGEWSRQGIAADSENWNFLIGGETGSGKSLLSGILCRMMYQFGLVDNENPVTLNAKALEEDCSILEQYSGKSRVVVIENIECICPKNEGGKEKGYGDIWRYVTALLTKEQENRNNRSFFIFSGECTSVERLTDENPKLGNLATALIIPAYSSDELHRIAKKLIRARGFCLTKEAERKLHTELKYEAVADSFANAVTIEQIIERAKENKGRRELETGHTDVYFQAEDFDFGVSVEDELNSLLSELDSMIGLEAVKERVKKDIHRILERRERLNRGEDTEKDSFFLHTVLLGAPGTGKTSVARLLGRIYGCLGILRNGSNFIEAGRSDLVGKYQGWSADKTKEIIHSAEGGVLFIDEAYALIQGEGDSFGHEVVDTLVQYAMNYRERMMIILAGYEKDMERLYAANPGLRRRFPNVLMFEDYTPEQLYEIFLLKSKGRYEIHPEAELPLRELITRYSRLRGYENGGGIDIHLERLAGVISLRNAENAGDGSYRNTILKEDVEAVLRDSRSNLPDLEELLKELDSMVGLQSVKETVRQAVRTQQYQKLVAEQMKVPVDFCPEHMLFVGPPGTGKSTVAKLLTKIYCALGIVKDPNRCVTVTRADLNSKYVGGALEAAKKKIEEARGGVLFVDEAYSLVQDEQDTNGIQVLTALMYAIEEYRGEILLIMAGYKEQLDEMIRKYNPGMASRISKTVCFEPYTVEEMVRIFYEMKKVDGITYEIEPGLELLTGNIIKRRMAEYEAEGKEFGNARGVRNLKNEAVNRLRMRCTTGEALLEPKNLTTICKEDLEGL